MEELQNFNFEGNYVRTVIIDNKPYFVGKDVAEILGYAKSRNAISSHVDNEDKKDAPIQGPLGGTQNMTIISESGVYSLIFGSHLESAKRFKHWVTSEVLPTIRKHGAYMTPEKIEEALLNPDTIINLAKQLKSEREGRLIAEQQVNELQPKATYYDRVLADKSLVTVSIIAKDYGMSGRALNKKLHDLGVIYKQGNTWLLYAKYQLTGWTHSDTTIVKRKDGTEKAVLNTKWTQKGRLGLYELLKQENILPLIEQKQTV
ncbi:phage antirepressor [Loigolactobacillus jiayinensis]|uniref:Phage antirepressor n=1 Tax=Loigolactobacillus jiayinensis TaxID=2486016 RepID=A0ABW1RFT7_9LACO|nr:phage antirepressor [Loigolactobacillus jiayinensis]